MGAHRTLLGVDDSDDGTSYPNHEPIKLMTDMINHLRGHNVTQVVCFALMALHSDHCIPATVARPLAAENILWRFMNPEPPERRKVD